MGISDRQFAVFGAAALALSTTFPVIASLIPSEWVSMWVGIVDVALAVIVVILAGLIDARARGRFDERVARATLVFCRTLAVVPLALLALFFLAGDSVRWPVLLAGLAWRAWIMMYTFPSAYTLWVHESVERAES
jgi:ABC-type dipeptide/oligopeptide/nickel transport system permease subunit